MRLMYELKFDDARARLAAWAAAHPADPMGPALEAASDLFQELYEKRVLTSDFFLNDKLFLGGIRDQPDAALQTAFFAAADRAETLGRARLEVSPADANALMALAMVAGMRSDDSAIIERRDMQSVRLLHEAARRAHDLLGVEPDANDAYIALGTANYVVGCMPGYKRLLLRLGGVDGNRALGVQQLSLAASNGHYMRPFAQILLALVALREKDDQLARRQLTDLQAQFPGNPLFASEMAKLNR